MDPGLRGKNALITGGASGIGFGISNALASEGVNLAIASRDPDPAAIETLKGYGVEVIAVPTDVSCEEQVRAMVSTTIGSLGSIDMYINNAAWSWHQQITALTTEAWLKTINTNLSACVWACREVAGHMIERKQGSILIIGSTAMYNPLYRETSYRVSKTGLKVFAEVLAVELAPYKIRVNVLIPGYFRTRLTAGMSGKVEDYMISQIPLRRPGDPDDVGAQAVVLLSDKLSGYTTGATVVIDGGLHLRPLSLYTDDELVALNSPS